MKLGIVLQSNTPERVWNTFRLGIVALKADHVVQIFLMSEGSELSAVPNTEHFDIQAKVSEFTMLGGTILACGTCLELRNTGKNNVCPVSTMSDLLKMIETSDKLLVF